MNVQKLVSELSEVDKKNFQDMWCSYNFVSEYSSEGKQPGPQTVSLPLFLGEDRIRFCSSFMNVGPKSTEEQKTSFLNFMKIISRHAKDPKQFRQIPAGAFVILDNQRYLHGVTRRWSSKSGSTCSEKKIDFDLPDGRSPYLDKIFGCVAPKGSLDLNSIPVSTEINMELVGGGVPTYWSPSGHSGVISKKRVHGEDSSSPVTPSFDDSNSTKLLKFVGSNSEDNDRGRKVLFSAFRRCGILNSDLRCINLFRFEHLYRSGEIFSQLLRACDVTNLPVGSRWDLDSASQYFRPPFSANAIAALPTVLMTFVLAAKNASLRRRNLSHGTLPENENWDVFMRNVRLIFFGGEKFPLHVKKLCQEVCHPDLQFLAIYGSAEGGIFGLQTPNTCLKTMSSNLDVYEFLDDLVHLEIVRDGKSLQIPDSVTTDSTCRGRNLDVELKFSGNLVVTTLIRRPWLIRFDTCDLITPIFVNGRRVPGVFRLLDRDPWSRSVSLVGTAESVNFHEIIEFVLVPLGLGENLSQIWVEPREDGMKFTLRVLSPFLLEMDVPVPLTTSNPINNTETTSVGTFCANAGTFSSPDGSCTNAGTFSTPDGLTNYLARSFTYFMHSVKNYKTCECFVLLCENGKDFVRSPISGKHIRFVEIK
eukprot:TRINITY_DN9167_c0_g1_i1.p1 TRINITY_DN9167_c0_g1~~TRINITY_DN9167_c0_g1_i1.p1  ORF type:complete len:645 (+),score=118.31 TRINITY_DN9167_c0_g1_i1:883-2817(+)